MLNNILNNFNAFNFSGLQGNFYWVLGEFFISISILTLLVVYVVVSKTDTHSFFSSISKYPKYVPNLSLTCINSLLFVFSIYGISLLNIFHVRGFLFYNRVYTGPDITFIKLIIVAIFILLLLYFKDSCNAKVSNWGFEMYLIMSVSVIALLFLIMCYDFLTFFFCLELYTLSAYILVSYNTTSVYSTEAGLKYFILGSFVSALMLYGIFLLYYNCGTLNFSEIYMLTTNLEVIKSKFSNILQNFINSSYYYKIFIEPYKFDLIINQSHIYLPEQLFNYARCILDTLEAESTQQNISITPRPLSAWETIQLWWWLYVIEMNAIHFFEGDYIPVFIEGINFFNEIKSSLGLERSNPFNIVQYNDERNFTSILNSYDNNLVNEISNIIIDSQLPNMKYDVSLFLLLPILLILIALLFKLSAAPFHMWTPDAYEGAPLIVTAFLSIIPKISLLYVFFKILWIPFHNFDWFWITCIIFSAICSLLVGSLVALYQLKLKRLFIYSMIVNIGYFLLAFNASSALMLQYLFVYLIYYLLVMSGVFVFLSLFKEFSSSLNLDRISNLTSLFYIHPVLSIILSILLFALIGLPPLALFVGKFFIFYSIILNYALTFIAILMLVLSVYYYLRLIKIIFFFKKDFWIFLNPISRFSAYYLIIISFLLLLFIFYPQILFTFTSTLTTYMI